MTDKNDRKKTIRSVILIIVAVAAGVGLAQLLPPDLFGLRGGSATAKMEATAAKTDKQLWTCGMHPHVIEEEPGQCPICAMDLVPMRGLEEDHAGHDHAAAEERWICPDHPNIVEDGPGECPIDGSQLVRAPVEEAAASTSSSTGGPRKILFYRNPMDPAITSPVPAKDSMGMDYVPVYDDAAGSAGESGATVRIDPAVVQNMNVRTEVVERRDLTQPIRTVGYLEFDQQRMVTVTTKYSGWVEKVYVNYVGEKVRRGQPLFEVYSPELVQTEQELLSALEFVRQLSDAPEDARERAESLVDSARTRLGYWDISKKQIARLEETGEVFRTLKVAAPSNGLVMKRMAGLEGMAIKPAWRSSTSPIWLACGSRWSSSRITSPGSAKGPRRRSSWPTSRARPSTARCVSWNPSCRRRRAPCGR